MTPCSTRDTRYWPAHAPSPLFSGRRLWRWRRPPACPPWRRACSASAPPGPLFCTSSPSPTAWRRCWHRWARLALRGCRLAIPVLCRVFRRLEPAGPKWRSMLGGWRRAGVLARRASGARPPALCLRCKWRIPSSIQLGKRREAEHVLAPVCPQVHNLCSTSAASLHQGVAALSAQVGAAQLRRLGCPTTSSVVPLRQLPLPAIRALDPVRSARIDARTRDIIPAQYSHRAAPPSPPRRLRRCLCAWPTRWPLLSRCSTRWLRLRRWWWTRCERAWAACRASWRTRSARCAAWGQVGVFRPAGRAQQ